MKPWLAKSAVRSRISSKASSSLAAITCARPLFFLCASGPPSNAISISSPVTLFTTSGPVTNIRPSGASTTTSVNAGPYAPPPAVGPNTKDNCGIRPLAEIID